MEVVDELIVWVSLVIVKTLVDVSEVVVLENVNV